MGRKRHRWGPVTDEPDGQYVTACQNCGMLERHGHFKVDGKVYSVLQWVTPAGRLLGVRPVVDIRAPKDAPSFADRFAGVPVTGSPECPKDPAAWPVG